MSRQPNNNNATELRRELSSNLVKTSSYKSFVKALRINPEMGSMTTGSFYDASAYKFIKIFTDNPSVINSYYAKIINKKNPLIKLLYEIYQKKILEKIEFSIILDALEYILKYFRITSCPSCQDCIYQYKRKEDELCTYLNTLFIYVTKHSINISKTKEEELRYSKFLSYMYSINRTKEIKRNELYNFNQHTEYETKRYVELFIKANSIYQDILRQNPDFKALFIGSGSVRPAYMGGIIYRHPIILHGPIPNVKTLKNKNYTVNNTKYNLEALNKIKTNVLEKVDTINMDPVQDAKFKIYNTQIKNEIEDNTYDVIFLTSYYLYERNIFLSLFDKLKQNGKIITTEGTINEELFKHHLPQDYEYEIIETKLINKSGTQYSNEDNIDVKLFLMVGLHYLEYVPSMKLVVIRKKTQQRLQPTSEDVTNIKKLIQNIFKNEEDNQRKKKVQNIF